MNRIYSVATYLLLIEGIAYAAAAFVVFQGRPSIDALRFGGTGLGWIFLAMLNVSASDSTTRRTVRLAVTANSLAALFFVILVLVKPGLISALAVLVILACLSGSILALRSVDRSPHSRPLSLGEE